MVNQNDKYENIRAAEMPAETAFSAQEKIQLKPVGSSGTELYGGYFSEEYLMQLRGRKGAKIWDEMRRSEPQVSMLMNAIMNPIKSALWEFVEADEEEVPDAEAHQELVEYNAKEILDWEAHLHEVLTFLYFGYSLFEIVHKSTSNDPKFGTATLIEALAFRSQKTIERWNVEKGTGKLLTVDQYVFGDVSDKESLHKMDANFLVLFSYQKEGDNYEGISLLRPMYGPWFRKNLYNKLMAIGIEKYAIGVPIGTVPAGKEKSEDFTNFKNLLSQYTSHECSFIIKPQGFEIEIQKAEFKASEIKEVILMENTEMVNSLVANFLALGTNGSGGAYSLGTDLSDFFLSGLQQFANLICGVWNRRIIPDIVKKNFGPQLCYPRLKCTGINDKAGKELAEIIGILTNSKNIRPDMKLEEFLRKQYKLPEPDTETAVAPDPQSPPPENDPNKKPSNQMPPDQMEMSERFKLGESYSKRFDSYQEDVKSIMQKGLKDMLDGMLSDIRKQWNASTPANRIKIATQISANGLPAYKNDLKESLAEVANQGLIDARQMVPSKKNIKLSESIQLAAPRGGYYAALPPALRKQIEMLASLLTETQAADLAKIVSFQFASSANSTEDIETILNDIEAKAVPVLEGSTSSGMSIEAAAGNAVSNALNQANLTFFFEPEVLDEIESFTFTNEDPVSQICQELAGTTFAANDPNVSRYSPPLHHLCKSRWTPNLKGDKGNPEIDRNGVSLSKKALNSITLCECSGHLEFAEDKGELQTIVISKKYAQGMDAARAALKKFGGAFHKVDETEESYRFRQRDPSEFVDGSFKTFQPTPGVSLVYGKLK